MQLKGRTVSQIAEMICGNAVDGKPNFFVYRSSWYLTKFFTEIDTDYKHDGSTRHSWVVDTLNTILEEPQSGANVPPPTFARVIERLMDQDDATDEADGRPGALEQLNAALARDGYQAFYADDKKCYLKHVATNTVATPPNPHRPFSPAEVKRRAEMTAFLDRASEDQMIEDVLLPLFRQLGFQRITAAGHRDKALEYGKDVWMKFTLPTMHVLYFGIQAKKGKLDSSGMSRGGNLNVAEIHNQALMMLGHEIFDPEIGKRVLVDHAYIIAGGEITKAARAWIGNKLDASKRSQIIFMDRNDILDLYTVTSLPVPTLGWGSSGAAPF